ncbi:Uncharacterised protein [Sebaldella termitidis]|uniref:Uncharacterized protein n=1 Tax=Sebaldella termitidis (strain ATCC 33386 / NCTC 11300) TaxID=526218 RepID=D1AS02_SEBTE|nr:hypothetical protein [Sebaldella termitidis]ACZ10989.1 hypothetical protein Sterm_4157 [Sebaldella termitidis ATCC 33386]SUI81205.1 Uncharacterised protein [Sebaldella termitidis]
MKKTIFLLFIIMNIIILAGPYMPKYDDINKFKAFNFYSGKNIDDSSSIIIIPGEENKLIFYINIDEIRTNYDMYYRTSVVTDIMVQNILNKKQGIEKSLQELIIESESKAEYKLFLFKNHKINEVKLKYTFIKGIESMAAKNQNLFLDNPKEKVLFINFTNND